MKHDIIGIKLVPIVPACNLVKCRKGGLNMPGSEMVSRVRNDKQVRCKHDSGLAHQGPHDDRGRTGCRRAAPPPTSLPRPHGLGGAPPPSPAAAPAPPRCAAAAFPTRYRDSTLITIGTATARAKALVMARLHGVTRGGEAPLPLPLRKPRPHAIPAPPSPPHSPRTAGTAFPSLPGRRPRAPRPSRRPRSRRSQE